MGSKTRWDHIPSGNKIQADFEQGIWTWWMGVGAARRNNRYGEEHHQRICACCPWKVSISSRGEQDYFSPEGIPTATEGCKSNALMRCCKDLGVASELWDPRYNRKFMTDYAKQIWVEHV